MEKEYKKDSEYCEKIDEILKEKYKSTKLDGSEVTFMNSKKAQESSMHKKANHPNRLRKLIIESYGLSDEEVFKIDTENQKNNDLRKQKLNSNSKQYITRKPSWNWDSAGYKKSNFSFSKRKVRPKILSTDLFQLGLKDETKILSNCTSMLVTPKIEKSNHQSNSKFLKTKMESPEFQSNKPTKDQVSSEKYFNENISSELFSLKSISKKLMNRKYTENRPLNKFIKSEWLSKQQSFVRRSDSSKKINSKNASKKVNLKKIPSCFLTSTNFASSDNKPSTIIHEFIEELKNAQADLNQDISYLNFSKRDLNNQIGSLNEAFKNDSERKKMEIKKYLATVFQQKFAFTYGKNHKGHYITNDGLDIIKLIDSFPKINLRYPFLIQKKSDEIKKYIDLS